MNITYYIFCYSWIYGNKGSLRIIFNPFCLEREIGERERERSKANRRKQEKVQKPSCLTYQDNQDSSLSLLSLSTLSLPFYIYIGQKFLQHGKLVIFIVRTSNRSNFDVFQSIGIWRTEYCSLYYQRIFDRIQFR